jgi:8-oxo-dGTP pyrophosphatase MutT (NUDIX family)
MTTPVKPIPAATLLLLRDSPRGIEILMQTRSDQAGFAGGALVFPGGKVSAEDEALCPHCAVTTVEQQELVYRISAIRETYEEGGVLLGRPHGEQGLLSHDALKALQKDHAGAINFEAFVNGGRVQLATDLLVRYAHWITPVGQPKRFDTHFFLAPAPNDQITVHDGFEATGSFWITARDAIHGADQGKFKLVFVTRLNLLKLRHSETVADALETARKEPVTTIIPEIIRGESGTTLRIPPNVGYDVTELQVGAGISRP